MNNDRKQFFVDLVVFQVAWFGCVIGSANTDYPLLFPIAGFLFVLSRIASTRRFRSAFPFLVASIALGMVGDSLLVRLELLAFYADPTVGGAPIWMILLWANFGLMLRPLFSWFLLSQTRCLIGFSLGGLLAYASGWQLDRLAFTTVPFSSLAIAFEWAMAGLVLRQLHLRYRNIDR